MVQAAPSAPGAVHGPRIRHSTIVRTDEHLLEQFLSQEDERADAAFTVLVERYGPIVQQVCVAVLGNSHEAQDAAQAVFMVLARKARSIRKPGSLGPWLHGVALRVARRARCDAARRRTAERRKAEITHDRDTARSGLETMEHAELHAEIHRLPEKYRQPIILCYMQGQTHEQAAQTLGWPLGTVQVRLHRGRERLRSRLTRSSAGVLALAGFDVATSPLSSPGRLEPEWVAITARAAVRFAAGQGTAGLVAPPVSGLAESVIAAMFADWLKVVVLLASPFFFGLLCLCVTALTANKIEHHESRREPKLIAATPTKPEPARTATIPEAVGEIARETPQSAGSKLPGDARASDGPRSLQSAKRLGSLAMVGKSAQESRKEGRELFERHWVKNDSKSKGGDGLGPVFNAQSCVACHYLGGTGGAGGLDRNVEVGTASRTLGEGMGYAYSFSMDFGSGRFEYAMGRDSKGSSRREAAANSFSMNFGSGRLEYRMGDDSKVPSHREPAADPTLLAAIHPGFRESRSIVLHRYGTDPAYNAWRESVPGRHGPILVESSQRNPPSLFGAGLIDSIPDAAIEAAARRKPAVAPSVKGRVSRLKDGRVGRFGWKAQTASLNEFVRSAAAGEIGLEVPGRHQGADPRLPGVAAPGLDMDETECNALVEYVRSLPAPLAIKEADDSESAQVKAGEASFKSIGCTACHVAKLGEVDGIYSDLLLHDMGPQLGDVDAYTVFVAEVDRANGAGAAGRIAATGAASVREWRTPPLWGVRDTGPYLHDGRAATIAQAITLHGGQGATAARRYADLSPRRKQQIEAFLASLAGPAGDR